MFDTLFEIDGNPVPDGASAGTFLTRDNLRLRYGIFNRVKGRSKGTVIILNGRNECIEKYFETIRDINSQGFGVATFDWRGQGGSDRVINDPHKGYVRRFSDYADDLEQFFSDIALPDCRGPFFILAHSTGALVAQLASPLLVNRIQRMIFCSPLFEFTGQTFAQPAVRAISTVLRYTGFGRAYMVGSGSPRETQPFIGNKLTSDPVRYRRNSDLYSQHPLLALGGPTVTWVNEACRAMAKVADPEFQARAQVPTLIIAAGNDQVVSTPAIERHAQGMRAGALLTIDGAGHEILQEADIYREQFLAAMFAFIPGVATA